MHKNLKTRNSKNSSEVLKQGLTEFRFLSWDSVVPKLAMHQNHVEHSGPHPQKV